jgi:gamma-glutamyl phosphate reductase
VSRMVIVKCCLETSHCTCFHCISGEEAVRLGLTERRVEDFGIEYGELIVAVEIVDSVNGAIRHIHQYGRYC